MKSNLLIISSPCLVPGPGCEQPGVCTQVFVQAARGGDHAAGDADERP